MPGLWVNGGGPAPRGPLNTPLAGRQSDARLLVSINERRRAASASSVARKIALLIAILWVLSPIDLLPEFLPVIAPLDDVLAVVLLLRYAARALPREVLFAAGQRNHDCLNDSSAHRRDQPSSRLGTATQARGR
jgi:uncharacterized membrane protein YkvA (DUF1232 family)